MLLVLRCLRWISKTQKELGNWWGSAPGEQELGKKLRKFSSLTEKWLKARVEVVRMQRNYRKRSAKENHTVLSTVKFQTGGK